MGTNPFIMNLAFVIELSFFIGIVYRIIKAPTLGVRKVQFGILIIVSLLLFIGNIFWVKKQVNNSIPIESKIHKKLD